MSRPIALTIAGFDPSGGAGVLADVKTFSAFGVYGAAAITALTVQNTLGVSAVETVTADALAAALDAVLSDLDVSALKTGMLGSAGNVGVIAARLRQASLPLVVDPVLVSTSGRDLLSPDAIGVLKSELIPLARLVTPNLAEAARLSGRPPAASTDEMIAQGQELLKLGAAAVLVKGGHGTGASAVDVLVERDRAQTFEAPRIDTPHTHGAGCTLSAAITALIARGVPLGEAVRLAKDFVTRALAAGRTQAIGHGRGPLDPLFAVVNPPLE